jgi:hypothetical protein
VLLTLISGSARRVYSSEVVFILFSFPRGGSPEPHGLFGSPGGLPRRREPRGFAPPPHDEFAVIAVRLEKMHLPYLERDVETRRSKDR